MWPHFYSKTRQSSADRRQQQRQTRVSENRKEAAKQTSSCSVLLCSVSARVSPSTLSMMPSRANDTSHVTSTWSSIASIACRWKGWAGPSRVGVGVSNDGDGETETERQRRRRRDGDGDGDEQKQTFKRGGTGAQALNSSSANTPPSLVADIILYHATFEAVTSVTSVCTYVQLDPRDTQWFSLTHSPRKKPQKAWDIFCPCLAIIDTSFAPSTTRNLYIIRNNNKPRNAERVRGRLGVGLGLVLTVRTNYETPKLLESMISFCTLSQPGA